MRSPGCGVRNILCPWYSGARIHKALPHAAPLPSQPAGTRVFIPLPLGRWAYDTVVTLWGSPAPKAPNQAPTAPCKLCLVGFGQAGQVASYGAEACVGMQVWQPHLSKQTFQSLDSKFTGTGLPVGSEIYLAIQVIRTNVLSFSRQLHGPQIQGPLERYFIYIFFEREIDR